MLILDEPTAVLTPQEVEELFKMIRSLTVQGHTVIMITHKLNEVMEICDRITVLRQGEVVGVLDKRDTDKDRLSQLMVGKPLSNAQNRNAGESGRVVLSIKEVTCRDRKGTARLENVSLQVKEGEILGIAGVDGNGQSELAEAIVGLRHVDGGKILLQGEEITNLSPRQILDKKVAHIPEDRHKRGVVLAMNLTENIMMMDYYRPPYAKGILLQQAAIEQRADQLLQEFNVKANSRDDLMKNLSGGNQQKVVLGREIMRNPDLLIAMHPARGLDISATEYVHQRLLEQRNQGKAVLLISTELDEIIKLSDRIAVFFEGKVMGVVPADTPIERIGLLMAGVK